MISSQVYTTNNYERNSFLVAKDNAYLGTLGSYKHSYGFVKTIARFFGWAIDVKIGNKMRTVSRADYMQLLSQTTDLKIDKNSVYSHTNFDAETLKPQEKVELMRQHIDARKRGQLTNKFYTALGENYDAASAMKYAGKGADIDFEFITWQDKEGFKWIKKGSDLPKRTAGENPEKVGENTNTVYTRYNPAVYAATCAEAVVDSIPTREQEQDPRKRHELTMKKLDKDFKITMQNLKRQMQQNTIQTEREIYKSRVLTQQMQQASDLLVNAMDPNKPIPKREPIAPFKEPEALYAYVPSDEQILKEQAKMKELAQFLLKLGAQETAGVVISRSVTKEEDAVITHPKTTEYRHQYKVTESVGTTVSLNADGSLTTSNANQSSTTDEYVTYRTDKNVKESKQQKSEEKYIQATSSFMRAGERSTNNRYHGKLS